MISRRQFLQVTGVGAFGLSGIQVANALALLSPAQASGTQSAFGRVLFPATVTNNLGIVISSLIPDTVVQINNSTATTYTLNQGVVRRNMIQPMTDFGAESNVPDISCPVEVIATVAAVRQWCAATAPVVSRVGHGGVLYAVDSLEVQGTRWLGVASQHDSPLIGWTEAGRWREAILESDNVSFADNIYLNRDTQQLDVFDGDHLLWSMSAAVLQTLPPGSYVLGNRQISDELPASRLIGVPWIHEFDAYMLSGAYWHNEFGWEAGRSLNGAPIQIPPAAARWIYRHFRSNGTLHVV